MVYTYAPKGSQCKDTYMLGIVETDLIKNTKTGCYLMTFTFNGACWRLLEYRVRVEGEDEYIDLELDGCDNGASTYKMSIPIPDHIKKSLRIVGIAPTAEKHELYILLFSQVMDLEHVDELGEAEYTLDSTDATKDRVREVAIKVLKADRLENHSSYTESDIKTIDYCETEESVVYVYDSGDGDERMCQVNKKTLETSVYS